MTGLGLALLAARATGKVIIDGVYNDVKNAEGFAAECAQGREMGFDGKTLIHPGQVEPANEAFAPSAKAVEDARGILAAWEAGRGSGVVTYNGRMIENPTWPRPNAPWRSTTRSRPWAPDPVSLGAYAT